MASWIDDDPPSSGGGGVDAGALRKTANLSDVSNAATAVENLDADGDLDAFVTARLASAGVLLMDFAFETNQNQAGTVTPPIPAGRKVGFYGQTNPAQNGYMLSDGAGGVTGPVVPIATSANYLSGILVVAKFLGSIDYAGYNLAPYMDQALLPADTTADIREVTSPDGMTFVLSPVGINPRKLNDYTGKWFSPAMNDYGGVNADTTLTINHQIVSCNPSEEITVTLPLHLNTPRHHYIVNKGSANVIVIGDSTDASPGNAFSHTLEPGHRCLILADQSDWDVWNFGFLGGEFMYGDEPTVVTFSGASHAIVGNDAAGIVSYTAEGTEADVVIATFTLSAPRTGRRLVPMIQPTGSVAALYFGILVANATDDETWNVEVVGTLPNGTFDFHYHVLDCAV